MVGIAGAIAYADSDSGLRTWWALRDDLTAAQARIERLRADVAALDANRGGLEKDSFAVERAIRERLEYAREGETVVRLDPPRGTSPRIP